MQRNTSNKITKGFLNIETNQPIMDPETEEYLTQDDYRITKKGRKWYFTPDAKSEPIPIAKYQTHKYSKIDEEGMRRRKQFALVDSNDQFIYVKDNKNKDTDKYVLVGDACISSRNQKGEYIYTDPNGTKTVVMRWDFKKRVNTIDKQSFYSLENHQIMVDANGNNLSWDECMEAGKIIKDKRYTYYQPQKDEDLTPVVRYKTFNNYKDKPKQNKITVNELSELLAKKKKSKTSKKKSDEETTTTIENTKAINPRKLKAIKENGFVYPDTGELIIENHVIVTRDSKNIKKAENSIYKYIYINSEGKEFNVTTYQSYKAKERKRKNQVASNELDLNDPVTKPSSKRNKSETPSALVITTENQVAESLATFQLINNSIFAPPPNIPIEQQVTPMLENDDAQAAEVLLGFKR